MTISNSRILMFVAGACAVFGGVVVMIATGPPASGPSANQPLLETRKLYRAELCKEIATLVGGVLDGTVREVDKAALALRDRGFCHSETRNCSDTISSGDWESLALQVASLEVVSSIYFGSEKEGILVGAEEPTGVRGARASLMRTNYTDCVAYSSCYLNWISVDSDTGERIANPLRISFDPRTRPWYTLAKNGESTTRWTAPYVSASNEENAAPLFGLSASRSVVSRRSGAVVGVVAADLYFQYIARWLERHEVGRSRDGVAMVLLPDMKLIASSSSSLFPIFKGSGPDSEMITAIKSKDMRIRSTGLWLMDGNPDLLALPGAVAHSSIDLYRDNKKNETLLLSAVSVVQPQTGLKIIVAVAVPLGDSPTTRSWPSSNAFIALVIAFTISVAAASFLAKNITPSLSGAAAPVETNL